MTRTTSLTLILALAASGIARAQPAPADPAAEAAYQEARRLYDLREWDAAIAKFKEAYRLRPDAASLFNIAQSNRLKGDCTEALNFYKTYKRNFPTEKNIDKVDKFIADMDACAKAAPKPPIEPVKPEPVKPEPVRPEPVKPPPVEPVRVAPPPVEPSSDPGHGKRIAGYVTGGAGLVSLAIGIGFALRAHSAANDASHPTSGEEWDPGIQTRGENSARFAKISIAVGGALLITGGVLIVLGKKQSTEASHVAVLPSHDGASLAWGSEF